MAAYIVRRLVWVVFLLFVVTLVTFVVFTVLPAADPAASRHLSWSSRSASSSDSTTR